VLEISGCEHLPATLMSAVRSRAPQVPRPEAASHKEVTHGEEVSPLLGSEHLFARYEGLLIRRPLLMQTVQAVALAAVGNMCNQGWSGREFQSRLLWEQCILNTIIAPITVLWLRVLRGWRLHWIKATLVDQFGFTLLMNFGTFYLRAATVKGGIYVATHPTVRLVVLPEVFPSIWAYEPIWSTRLKGLRLKLPATLVREKFVPHHLKGVWELLVRVVWNIIMASVLANLSG
jgi:hypothetical protein